MTDTDKLKRLAEELSVPTPIRLSQYQANEIAAATLALTAENERLRAERDEAVALLRECWDAPMEPWGDVRAFLDKLDGAAQ